jgi:hypothetical protein
MGARHEPEYAVVMDTQDLSKEEQLKELRRAYATGALRVKFGETDVTYRSEQAMKRVIENLERDLGLWKPMIIQVCVNKGL